MYSHHGKVDDSLVYHHTKKDSRGVLYMENSQQEIYKLNTENLEAVKELLTMVESDLKQLLSLDPNETGTVIHNYQLNFSFLTGAYIENLYYQLVYKPKFTDKDRSATFVNSTETDLEEKWQILLEYSFKKGYKLNMYEDLSKGVDYVTNLFYNELKKFLKVELHYIMKIRESIAHGQFIHSFNPSRSSLNPDNQHLLVNQDLFTVKLRIKKFNLVAKIILDLITSPQSFILSFDYYFNIYDSLGFNYSPEKYVEFLQQVRK